MRPVPDLWGLEWAPFTDWSRIPEKFQETLMTKADMFVAHRDPGRILIAVFMSTQPPSDPAPGVMVDTTEEPGADEKNTNIGILIDGEYVTISGPDALARH